MNNVNGVGRHAIRPAAPPETTTLPAPPRRPRSEPPKTSASGTFAKEEYVHVGFRVLESHARMLRQAADKATGGNLAQYLRQCALPWAASDVGLEAPDLRIYEYVDVIKQAADTAGVSVQEFQAHAAREAARAILGIK